MTYVATSKSVVSITEMTAVFRRDNVVVVHFQDGRYIEFFDAELFSAICGKLRLQVFGIDHSENLVSGEDCNSGALICKERDGDSASAEVDGADVNRELGSYSEDGECAKVGGHKLVGIAAFVGGGGVVDMANASDQATASARRC